MPEFLIRTNEGCAPDPTLLWDSVHIDVDDGADFVCDWAIATSAVLAAPAPAPLGSFLVTGASHGITIAEAVAPGSLILLGVLDNSGVVGAVTDSAGSSYEVLQQLQTGAGATGPVLAVMFARVPNGLPGGTVLTYTPCVSSAYYGVVAYAVAGANFALPFDPAITATLQANTLAPAVTSGQPSTASELVFAIAAVNGSGTFSLPNAWGDIQQAASSLPIYAPSALCGAMVRGASYPQTFSTGTVAGLPINHPPIAGVIVVGIQSATQIAPPLNDQNAGGLQAVAELGTAVYLMLFSDQFVPPDHPLAYLADGNNRGWWGDGVDVRADLGEGPLGSWLWLLERAPMVAAGTPIEQWAETFAAQALAPLQAQGAVANIVVSAEANVEMSRVELSVQLYGDDGGVLFERRFDLAWKQLRK